jgi:hypothetical protein
LKGTRVLEIQYKKSLGLDRAIQGERLMRCHRTLGDWIYRYLLAEIEGFIYKKLLQKEADLPALRTMAEDPMNYHQWVPKDL